ncbi:hydroxyacylglutathione hydrolase [Chromatiales bacterium (ex Bugula neritina AB1)]|nr:hydroxyacylglutathione hydrolase [Chromatiales bacterium (ex Bugula neritina AB1)]
MPSLDIFQYPYNSDNYGILLHSRETGETAAIDAGDANALQAALKDNGWSLSHIFITHHHADHTAGLETAKKNSNCKVTGPGLSSQIPGLDKTVVHGDTFQFAGVEIQVIHTPGHTRDMMNFYLPSENAVFTGDTLFALGCGRLFEGDAEMMWNSLELLKKLPPETTVYCSHEYTEANASFAITIDPENEDLISRIESIREKRANNQPTVPSKLSEELRTNPFLRADAPEIRAQLNMQHASDVEVFAEIRARKDNF